MNYNLPKFDNEIHLQNVIAALLLRIKGLSAVQKMQGAQEYGKDLVFIAEGPFKESVYCACVIKNVKLNGRVGKTGSLRAVYDQIEQALDTPFIDDRGESRRIERVYVISPEEITQDALHSLQGKLDARFGQVVFRCGVLLYEMFVAHWPEFMADEAKAVQTYMSTIDEASRSSVALTRMSIDFSLPAEAAQQSIYVLPQFERIFGTYEVTLPLEWILMQGQWDISWTKDIAQNFQTEGLALSHLVNHFEAWQTKGLSNAKGYSVLIEVLHSAMSYSTEAFFSEGKKKKSNELDFMVEYNNRMKHNEIVSKILPQKVVELRSLISDYRTRLNSTVERHNSGVAHLKIDDLGQPWFFDHCRVDDALKAYNGKWLRKRAEIRIPLGRNVMGMLQRALVVDGGPGSGKTSFCKWNALLDAQNLVAGKGDLALPVYYPLHEFAVVSSGRAEDLFNSRIGRSALIGDEMRKKSKYRRLYLDGLDEVSDPIRREELIKTAKAKADEVGTQVVVTVRDYVMEPSLGWALRVSLAGLSDDMFAELAEKWLNENPEECKKLLGQLKDYPALKNITRVPLLAIVLILVYKRTGRIPEGRANLYTMFTNLLCGGWDLAKMILRASHFTVAKKMYVLNHVGHACHEKRVREFGRTEFVGMAQHSLSGLSEEQIDLLVDELVCDGILTRTMNMYEFRHLSFQEFYAARFLLGDPLSKSREVVLMDFLEGEDWWREVLLFYVGLAESPERTALWLLDHSGLDNGRLRLLMDGVKEAFPDFDTAGVYHRKAHTRR